MPRVTKKREGFIRASTIPPSRFLSVYVTLPQASRLFSLVAALIAAVSCGTILFKSPTIP